MALSISASISRSISSFGAVFSHAPGLRFAARLAAVMLLVIAVASIARAQGPAPESAPPLFPGGALISYSSTFYTRGLPAGSAIPATARPTLSHDGEFNFTWGFHPDWDVTVLAPIVTNRFMMRGANAPTVGGTGLGDTLLLAKYRFYRQDSERGTTQASVTFGPKLPTGRTDLDGPTGLVLPAGLQPGSGSTDLFLGADWTYTGLFNLKRLVADDDFRAMLRSQGTQATRLGSSAESRFWLSYRPYESKDVRREWFIGPALTWMHSADDRIGDATQNGSGGDALLAGITTFVGVAPGTHVWLAMDWDVAHTRGAAFMPVRRHISFGITRQFRMHFWSK